MRRPTLILLAALTMSFCALLVGMSALAIPYGLELERAEDAATQAAAILVSHIDRQAYARTGDFDHGEEARAEAEARVAAMIAGGWISRVHYDTSSDSIVVSVRTTLSFGPIQLPIQRVGWAEIGVLRCSLAGPDDECSP